jgi:Ca2+-binding RTX toxin-like protein
MAAYAFLEHANDQVLIPSFDPAADTLEFPDGYSASQLSLQASPDGAVVVYGQLSVVLGGVDAAALDGAQFVFDNGSVFLQGSAGGDSLAGSDVADRLELGSGGSDTVVGADGNDVIVAGASLDASDQLDGGLGTGDTLLLAGEYANPVVLGATTATGIEQFVFGQGGTVRLTLDDAVHTTSQAGVSFDATRQGAGDGLALDGSGVSFALRAQGGNGSDSLLGGSAADSLTGGVGADSLSGGDGADTLFGGLDADTLTGGGGNDRFSFSLGFTRSDSSPSTTDTITDFGFGDILDLPGSTVEGRALVFNMQALDFEYTGGSSGQQDFVNAHDGFADIYWHNDVADGRFELWVDANDDGLFSDTDLLLHLSITGPKNWIGIEDFADNFVAWRGTGGSDSFTDDGGDIEAYGMQGNDTLDGGGGADRVYGGEGNDSVSGGDGNDQLAGGSGADTLRGGAGDDSLQAEGSDAPNAGGQDAPGTLNFLHGGAGNDVLAGGAGNDALHGEEDNDLLSGDGGNDILLGGLGDDQLEGGVGSDTLAGGYGNDTLVAGGDGTGTDILDGGDGDDVLFATGDRVLVRGGDGADRFVFSHASSDVVHTSQNLVQATYSTVAATVRVQDFDFQQGDRIRTGITLGTALDGVPVVWRGTADAGFRATVGQELSLAGSTDARFFEFWTYFDDVTLETVLFMDRTRDGVVNSEDLKIVFNGPVSLDASYFTEGTFTAKIGTNGDDGNTQVALAVVEDDIVGISGTDLAFGLAGNDTLDAGDGNDTVNGDGGNDVLLGGYGADHLYGGIGGDSLQGGSGNDELRGGAGADTLEGGEGGDWLHAEGARDSTNSAFEEDAVDSVNVLRGEGGNDHLFGGHGDDQLDGGTGSDQLSGGDGDDSLEGGDEDDSLTGDGGNDTLRGSAGADQLSGGSGNDSLEGGSGDDRLFSGGLGSTGEDTLKGGEGDDALYGLGERVELTGGGGADRFAFTSWSSDFGTHPDLNFLSQGFSTRGNAGLVTDFDAGEGDLLRTGIGNGVLGDTPLVWRGYTSDSGFLAALDEGLPLPTDPENRRFIEFWTFSAGPAMKVLFADSNRNGQADASDLMILFFGTGPQDEAAFTAGTFTAKFGTDEADTDTLVALTEDADLAFALDGDDTLTGAGGNDTLNGDAGNDGLDGGAEHDSLYGGAGNDALTDTEGSNVLVGGTGSDTLTGGDGSDTLYADYRNDSTDSPAVVDDAGTVNELHGGGGGDILYGGAGNDQLYGEAGSDALSGGEGNDLLEGGEENDGLQGGSGNDSLAGGDGDDHLNGEEGRDTLEGGAGNDSLTGSGAAGTIDTLDGGAGDDVLRALGGGVIMTGGEGADRFVFGAASSDFGDNPFHSIIAQGYSTVASPVLVTDFNDAQGDRVRTGIGDGLFGGTPLVWRGAAGPGFNASPGQSTALAGTDPGDLRFLEFWTFQEEGRTSLFIDVDRNGVVDATDVRVDFTGLLSLSPSSFTDGTFVAKIGTCNDDTDTGEALGTGNDLAFGLSGDDSLDGLDGSDVLNGDGGQDTIQGGLGDDQIYGGADNDSLTGGDGRDQLHGGKGSDTLLGGEDDDSLSADGAMDSIGSPYEQDTELTTNLLDGGAGNDNLQGAAGNDILLGNADNDVLSGAAGNDSLHGGDGADQLYAGTGRDTLQGGAGDDLLRSDGATGLAGVQDILNGGAGDDVLLATGSDAVVMTGGVGADRFGFTSAMSDGGSNWGFHNIVLESYANVARTGVITDFNQAEGDRLRTGIGQGMVGNVHVLWRGEAAPGFRAEEGESLTEAAADAGELPYYELWYTKVDGKTIVFLDRNRDRDVDEDDLRIEIQGEMDLTADSFTAGTFVAVHGTANDDNPGSLACTDEADTLLGMQGNDSVVGGAGGDWIAGNQGHDFIGGDAGHDTLLGGLGNDTLLGQDGNDVLAGGSGSDTLSGGSGNDELHAFAWNDYIGDINGGADGGSDQLLGGDGDDTLWGHSGNDTLEGGGDDDQLYGADGHDSMQGGFNNDTLYGGDGADTLDGGDGVDQLAGEGGDDTYLAGNGADAITEDADGGTDTVVFTGSSWVLAEHFENATATATSDVTITGNAVDNVLRGHTGDDTLHGGDADDTLVGGGGADYLYGEGGDDTYEVDAGDVITEVASGGTDTVVTTVTRGALEAAVENLRLGGTAAINGTGNAAANVLTGNGAANMLDGGLGADTMAGGLGNDTYVVDNVGDTVSETSATGGIDTVQSTISYTLGANLEHLTLLGAAASGTGNALANNLSGNGLNNLLDGGSGADTMAGGLGNDTYDVDNAADVVNEAAGAGTDTVESMITHTLAANVENLVLGGAASINGTGNVLNNSLRGNAASNVLNGGAGADTMVGGAGNDTYIVDNAADAITEAAGAGTDTVQAAVTHVLAGNVENLALTGSAAINGTGNTLANVITGNAGSNLLNGGTGADVMAGGLGNDTYVVDNLADDVNEAASAGTDAVQAAVSFTLDVNIENLVLTGTAAINGTGNTLANSLTGNAAANVLNGAGGADTMSGGLGNDTYHVDHTGDVVTEAASAGTDTVVTTVTRGALEATVENLALAGTGAINGTGNGLGNVLTGNGAANVLGGAAGNDTLSGGGGADTLFGGAGKDVLTGGDGADKFVFQGATETTTAAFDVVSLFSRTQADKIDLTQLDGNAAVSGVQDMLFIGTGAFSTTNATGQLRYEVVGTNKLMVYGSTDRDTAAEFAIEVNGVASLRATDFLF